MVKKKKKKKFSRKDFPTLNLTSERDIAMDFSVKVYRRFDKIIKAIILFGSSVKNNSNSTSDIDLIIVVDDASIQWDQELVAWYREELGKIVATSPYSKEIHINTVKLTTWWSDLLKGDPVIVNVLRYGEAMVDIGGFFDPLKALLIDGRIKSTPEAIYVALNRAPEHYRRSKAAELGAIEGLFWAMVDSAQAALMSAGVMPPSPEYISAMLKENFVDRRMLKIDYSIWFRDIYILHRKIVHGDVTDMKGAEIDIWQDKTERFIAAMTQIVRQLTESGK